MGRATQRGPLVPWWVGAYNLRQLHKKARAWEWSLGIEYYQGLRNRILMEVAPGLPVSDRERIGVYASISPNNSENSCMRDSDRLIKAFLAGRQDTCPVHTYGQNKAKAVQILNGLDPTEVLRAPKTSNFFHNILDPVDARYVTIDGHMVCIWQGRRLPLDQSGCTNKEYEVIKSGVCYVANTLSIVPAQLQSILWLTWKRVHKILYDPQLKLTLT